MMNITPEFSIVFGIVLVLLSLSVFALNSIILAIYNKNPQRYESLLASSPLLRAEYERKYKKEF